MAISDIQEQFKTLKQHVMNHMEDHDEKGAIEAVLTIAEYVCIDLYRIAEALQQRAQSPA